MATKGKVQHNMKRIQLSEKYRSVRTELRDKAKNIHLTEEERTAARKALCKLPRNSAHVRVRNRCELTGRPRGFLRKFKLSRMKFRELALFGQIPGVTKSSW